MNKRTLIIKKKNIVDLVEYDDGFSVFGQSKKKKVEMLKNANSFYKFVFIYFIHSSRYNIILTFLYNEKMKRKNIIFNHFFFFFTLVPTNVNRKI